MQTGLVVRGPADCCFGRMMVGPARQGSAHKRNTKTQEHINTQTDLQGNTAKQKCGSRAWLSIVWSVVLLIAASAECWLGPGRGIEA